VSEQLAQCGCGHDREAHEHYRRGSDCGVCGDALCSKFKVDARLVVNYPASPPGGRASAGSRA
jgi:hypothetical protein